MTYFVTIFFGRRAPGNFSSSKGVHNRKSLRTFWNAGEVVLSTFYFIYWSLILYTQARAVSIPLSKSQWITSQNVGTPQGKKWLFKCIITTLSTCQTDRIYRHAAKERQETWSEFLHVYPKYTEPHSLHPSWALTNSPAAYQIKPPLAA